MADLIDEHEIVVLTEEVPVEDTFGGPKKDLRAGTKGTIVDVRTNPDGYTVEFKSESEGRFPNYHLANLSPDQVRPADTPAKVSA
ncbi:MAG: hypothetical protein BRD47_01180 [Bacteroidetes bacterium QS_8_68_28]|nr:MAG: hypothetical protein BRD47_01180 [Bacteroidetes bacterium QS_8_68_28]